MTNPCDTVLIPSELRIKIDYSVAQSYVYVNAERDYEKLKSGKTIDQSLNIVYKVFELDLATSSSAQDFQERVRQRLTSMGFSMTAEQAESHYRRGIEPYQANAWLECQRLQTEAKKDSAQLLAYVGEVTKTAAAVHLDYRSGLGNKNHVLTILVEGGLINGQATVVTDLGGPDNTVWQLTRASGTSQALVTANVPGATASLKIDFDHIPSDGMDGDTIVFARRAGKSKLESYDVWTPPEIEVTAFSAPYRWIADGKEYMNISVSKSVILFEITHTSQFYDYGSPGFDGFVLRGFDREIKSAALKSSAPLQLELQHNKDEVSIDIRGKAPPGANFALHLEFE